MAGYQLKFADNPPSAYQEIPELLRLDALSVHGIVEPLTICGLGALPFVGFRCLPIAIPAEACIRISY